MRPPSDGSAATAVFVDDAPARLRTQLERLAAGDRTALGELFVAYGDLVYQTALRLTGSRADAEDVTQELFLRLAGAVGEFTGGPSSFPGWIRRVAVRQALMQMRSGRRRREVDVDDVASLVAPADDMLNRLTLEAALARLSAEHRLVFLLKEVEGLSHAEIAELAGISVANSEVRLHRARRELRDMLRGSR
jgi:RNA polymerase sigma-70 factor (ECF subfamily)